VAVCGFVDLDLDHALTGESRLVVVALNVRDPGNVGTLVRCGDAAGADAVIVAGSSVDPYNDKVVRASVGSLFHVPLVVGTTLEAAVMALHARDFAVVAAEGTAQETLGGTLAPGSLGDRVAWVFGNEAWGLPDSDRALCDREVAVPIYGRAESLNVATAAAVCLYATAWAQRDDRDRPIPSVTKS
jgi:TrmH family RNA methyltransferase